MKIEHFLQQSIEEYLFKDLENISGITTNNGEAGEGSYPMLTSILAGIELLGAVLNPGGSVDIINKKSIVNGDKHFTHFWIYYLSVYDKKYSNFRSIFHNLLRNGIVHTFMVKQHIIVYKSSENHMKYDDQFPLIIIGCVELFNDFKNTFNQKVKSILRDGNPRTGITREKIQSNIDDLLKLYSEEATHEFEKLKESKSTPTFSFQGVLQSGASLSPVGIDELLRNSGGTVTPSRINLPIKK